MKTVLNQSKVGKRYMAIDKVIYLTRDTYVYTTAYNNYIHKLKEINNKFGMLKTYFDLLYTFNSSFQLFNLYLHIVFSRFIHIEI